jgi:uncharacterized membrane protein
VRSEAVDPWAVVALIVLAALGLAISAFMLLITYGRVAADARWVPWFCRMDEGTCRRVVHAPQARAFGVPNAALGVAWYIVVATWAMTPAWAGISAACVAMTVASAGVVAFSAWLAWVLIGVIRTPCVLCFTSHVINVLVLVTVVVACWP